VLEGTNQPKWVQKVGKCQSDKCVSPKEQFSCETLSGGQERTIQNLWTRRGAYYGRNPDTKKQKTEKKISIEASGNVTGTKQSFSCPGEKRKILAAPTGGKKGVCLERGLIVLKSDSPLHISVVNFCAEGADYCGEYWKQKTERS